MKGASLILPTINMFVWGAVAWYGHEGMKGVEARVGHSSLAQVEFYIVLPLVVLLAVVVPALFLLQTRWPKIGTGWSIVGLFVLLPYGCFYTGGI